MEERTNRQILLLEKPADRLSLEHFRLTQAPAPAPQDGEVLLRVRYISLDAANRAWMQGATYRAAVEAGTVMAGAALAEVVLSRADGFAAGDSSSPMWQDYVALPARQLVKVPKIAPLTHLLASTASPARPRIRPRCRSDVLPGETVGPAAAGSVGSLVGQIGKIKGCRVVGIAGGPEKCAWLTGALGFDAAVDYKAGNLFKALKAAAPQGIDVYFDNVGGDILEACLAQMNLRGRIACCGAVSQYDRTPAGHGPRGVPGLIVVKRLVMQGFIVTDYFKEREAALADLQSWVAAGRLTVQEDVIDGWRTRRAPDRPPGGREPRQADGTGRVTQGTANGSARR